MSLTCQATEECAQSGHEYDQLEFKKHVMAHLKDEGLMSLFEYRCCSRKCQEVYFLDRYEMYAHKDEFKRHKIKRLELDTSKLLRNKDLRKSFARAKELFAQLEVRRSPSPTFTYSPESPRYTPPAEMNLGEHDEPTGYNPISPTYIYCPSEEDLNSRNDRRTPTSPEYTPSSPPFNPYDDEEQGMRQDNRRTPSPTEYTYTPSSPPFNPYDDEEQGMGQDESWMSSPTGALDSVNAALGMGSHRFDEGSARRQETRRRRNNDYDEFHKVWAPSRAPKRARRL